MLMHIVSELSLCSKGTLGNVRAPHTHTLQVVTLLFEREEDTSYTLDSEHLIRRN